MKSYFKIICIAGLLPCILCSCAKISDPSADVSLEAVISAEQTDWNESTAIDILSQTLQQSELHYRICGDYVYLGQNAYSIHAFQDEDDHIITKGFYLVLQDSHEVYQENLVGDGYIKISYETKDSPQVSSCFDFPRYDTSMELGGDAQYDILKNNPIDKQYLQEEIPTSTYEMLKFKDKYTHLWNAEMENALSILRESMPPESIEKIETAQRDWEIYMKSDIAALEQIQLDTSGYGTIVPVNDAQRDFRQTRQRALELIEYCIKATGTYTYVYTA